MPARIYAGIVPAYIVWLHKAMKRRCYAKNCKGYRLYGGRGIRVCKRWRNSVLNFFEDMGPRPSHLHTLERKNGNGNYCPENCCWATRKQQSRNRPSWNLALTYKGKTACASEHGEAFGLSGSRVRKRLRLGWSLKKALETPTKTFVPMTQRLKDITKEQLLDLHAKLGPWKTVAKALDCPIITFQRLRRKFGLTPKIPQRGKRYSN